MARLLWAVGTYGLRRGADLDAVVFPVHVVVALGASAKLEAVATPVHSSYTEGRPGRGSAAYIAKLARYRGQDGR